VWLLCHGKDVLMSLFVTQNLEAPVQSCRSVLVARAPG
jgi:hypothetical protein